MDWIDGLVWMDWMDELIKHLAKMVTLLIDCTALSDYTEGSRLLCPSYVSSAERRS